MIKFANNGKQWNQISCLSIREGKNVKHFDG
jgi:hypothetical protein